MEHSIWLWTTAGWREYIDHPLLGYSDYSGTALERSNVAAAKADTEEEGGPSYDGGYHLGSLASARNVDIGLSDVPRDPADVVEPYYLRDRHGVPDPADVVGYIGGYGTRGVYLRADSDYTREILAALASYPVLDDSRMSEIEMAAEDEAIPDCLRDLSRMLDDDIPDPDPTGAVTRAVAASDTPESTRAWLLGPPLPPSISPPARSERDAYDDIEGNIPTDALRDAMEETGVCFAHETGGGAYLPIGRVFNAWRDALRALLPDGHPFSVAYDRNTIDASDADDTDGEE